jgi:NADPH2:quinone reductase
VHAIVCRELGPPEQLTLHEVDPNPIGPGQLRVAVKATGLNYVDALFVMGDYQIKPPLPFTPGSELAGEIIELGADVEGWAIGDRVFASIGLGAFADQAVISAKAAMAIPDEVSDPVAATFGQSYCTGEFGLLRSAGLQSGDSLLVLGAGGGVGLAAVDIGVGAGAKVIAAASSEEKLDACRALGAQATINYSEESLKDRARELSDGGVDIAYDPVGGDLSEQALRALGYMGRLVIIGFAAGIPKLPTNQVLLRNRRVMGVDWGAWGMENPADSTDLLESVLAKVGAGTYRPTPPTEYALSDCGQAMRDLLDRQLTGKAVLIP